MIPRERSARAKILKSLEGLRDDLEFQVGIEGNHTAFVSVADLRLALSTPQSPPDCGFCEGTGIAPWIIGDVQRACGYCEKGEAVLASGYFVAPSIFGMRQRHHQ